MKLSRRGILIHESGIIPDFTLDDLAAYIPEYEQALVQEEFWHASFGFERLGRYELLVKRDSKRDTRDINMRFGGAINAHIRYDSSAHSLHVYGYTSFLVPIFLLLILLMFYETTSFWGICFGLTAIFLVSVIIEKKNYERLEQAVRLTFQPSLWKKQ